ncbi:oxidoreductase domain-containing protein [Paenibacillus algicola]|uniref:Oxidoreductase domain-containing protein n=1 Tax=Paenibacillus algicola TaxID=2565926 RepID=A0A4P8XGZ4_9BACL|nr:Gfo/Idh/MocA family oxidoreductase [Paenibacillus algicola]QCT01615.1 oxidoreductase domain-containing protein [Paenibacillus algicola]
MNTIQKMAVIGLGHMGKHMIHRLLPQFKGQIELSAICDSHEERLRREAAEIADSPRLYTDYRQLLNETELDMVYIAVPPSLHENVAKIAFEKGLHVFCEKPLANSLEEARVMTALAERSGKIHAVHFSLPLDPAVLKMKALLKERAIGAIAGMNLFLEFPQWPRAWQHNAWITSRQQGGYLLEVGIHWIQMIQQVFGPITHVQSQVTFPEDASQCESLVRAVLRLEDGTDIQLSGTDRREGDERVSLVIHGEEGRIALENWRDLQLGGPAEAEMQPVPLDDVSSPLPMLKQFLQCIQGEPGVIFNFHDGYNAQVILEALRHPGEGWVDVRDQLLGYSSAEM